MIGSVKQVQKNIKRKVKRFRQRHVENFIFIHINKTGGSSVTKALNTAFQHKTALEKIDELGERKWDRSYTFAFVRNPWDKVVSHFHYRIKTNQTSLADKTIDFRDWVRLSYGLQDPAYYDKPKMFMPQSDWLSNHNGDIIVDFVGRFEHLDQDFNSVCKTIKKNVELPHVKASSRGNYQDYYDDETIEIVEEWFSQDIKNFGYHF